MRGAIIVAVLCLCLPRPAWSDVWAVTWTDCLREARLRNPELAAAGQRIKVSAANRALARSDLLPQLSSDLSLSVSKSSSKDRSNSHAYGASASQLLFDGFQSIHNFNAASENLTAAQYEYEVVASNVRLELRVAFVGLLYAQFNRDVVKDIAHRRQQSLDLIRLRYESGSEHKGSLMTAQANLAQAQSDVVEAERDIELSQRRLAKALGLGDFRPMTAVGNLELPAADRSKPEFEALLQTVPLLRELAAVRESARYGLKSAKADFFPKVFASAGAGRSDSRWPPAQNNWSAGLSLSLPLFQGGAQQAQLDRAKAVLGQAQQDERSGRDGVLLTLVDTWTEWQNSLDDVSVQQHFFEAAKVRARIAQAQYGAGLINFNDWIIIEDNLVNTQKNYLRVQSNAFLAEAGWAQAKGVSLNE